MSQQVLTGGRKRILLTADTVGGVWTFALELAAGLIRNGWSVALASFGPPVTEVHKRDAAIEGLRWSHCNSKLEWMEDPWDDIERAAGWLRGMANRENPDLLHLNTLCHGDLDWGIPVITTVHSCVSSWWVAVKPSPLPSHWGQYCRKVERSLRSATFLITPTLAAMRATCPLYDLPVGEELVVPNGRSEGIFKGDEKKPIIFTAGRIWDEAKNVRALAGIAPRLRWKVYVAGETMSPDGEPVAAAGCQMLGQLTTPELVRWYGKASIYVSLAKYEPFGLAVLEAAMSGCALVLSDIPTLRELWSGAAVFCPVNDEQRLEEALQKLISNGEYRRTMAARALLRSKRFTQEKMVAGYLAAYQAAMGKPVQDWSHACAS